MSAKRYAEEFKIEAVKQVTERGHPVSEVAGRLGVTTHSLYEWIKRYGMSEGERDTGPLPRRSVQRRHSRSGTLQLVDNRPYARQAAQLRTNGRATAGANHHGLPAQLKSGIESLSGMNMVHVKVHYDSSQPAQLNARVCPRQ